jgi:hypothetical protein
MSLSFVSLSFGICRAANERIQRFAAYGDVLESSRRLAPRNLQSICMCAAQDKTANASGRNGVLLSWYHQA